MVTGIVPAYLLMELLARGLCGPPDHQPNEPRLHCLARLCLLVLGLAYGVSIKYLLYE
jgi:hypothetical protein